MDIQLSSKIEKYEWERFILILGYFGVGGRKRNRKGMEGGRIF